METVDCAKLLAELKPPLLSLKRKDYRPYVTSWVAARDMEEVRTLLAFLECDISRVVTRIMDWQYNRARLERQAAGARPGAGKAGARHGS